MAQSSSSSGIQLTGLEALGRCVSQSFEAHPIQSFIAGVSIYLLTVAGFAWLMVQWIASDASDKAVPPQKCASCGSTDIVKAGSKDTPSQDKKK
jgi:hypothetical protein